jgi:hypothetical protein
VAASAIVGHITDPRRFAGAVHGHDDRSAA